MSKKFKWVVTVLFVVALMVAVAVVVAGVSGTMDSVEAMAAAQDGETWVVVADGGSWSFRLVDQNGRVQRQFSVSRTAGGEMVHIADMAVDADGVLFYLKHYSDPATGRLTGRQELAAYRYGFWPFGRHKSIRLDSAEEGDIRYINVQAGTSISLVGTRQSEGNLTGFEYRILDTDELLKNNLVIKRATQHALVAGEGVYQAAAVGSEVIYLAKTGVLYAAPEGGAAPRRLYPAAEQVGTYVTYVATDSSESVIIGEQRSAAGATVGAMMRLYPGDGHYEYLLEEDQSFRAVAYTGREVLEVDRVFGSESAYTALVQNPSNYDFELVVAGENTNTFVGGTTYGVLHYFGQLLGRLLLYYLILLLAGLIVYSVWWMTYSSRTLLLKLVFSSIPLMVLALALFGTSSYLLYQNRLMDTYQEKVTDQGALMRVLLLEGSTTTTFDSLTSPARYTSEEYSYLQSQMNVQRDNRSMYISSTYYSGGRMYTGVDLEQPLLFPVGITGDAQLYRAGRLAAMSGEQQALVVDDALGRRIACITPVGSSDGSSVFLVETSIFETVVQEEIASFLMWYLLLAAVCIVAAAALLMIAFVRIVRPIRTLTDGLERFSRGDRTARIVTESNDELADMGRVFNKMADDIDAQLYDLKTMSDIYYRFVPRRILHLLGKQNLGQVALGSSVEGRYCILSAVFYPRTGRENEVMALTNRFFEVVHTVAGEHDATVVADSGNLRSLSIICPSGGAAVALAMQALAQVDSLNTTAGITQMLEVSFLLHAAEMVFAICGDSERYVPSMLSAELERVVEQCEDYRRLSSRLLVTEAAYRQLDAGATQHRFIGYAPDDEQGIGLYDFYGSGSVESIRTIESTRAAFDKAMALYRQQRWYDAKNLFAAVLRENQHDNVARHYIFLCEKRL